VDFGASAGSAGGGGRIAGAAPAYVFSQPRRRYAGRVAKSTEVSRGQGRWRCACAAGHSRPRGPDSSAGIQGRGRSHSQPPPAGAPRHEGGNNGDVYLTLCSEDRPQRTSSRSFPAPPYRPWDQLGARRRAGTVSVHIDPLLDAPRPSRRLILAGNGQWQRCARPPASSTPKSGHAGEAARSERLALRGASRQRTSRRRKSPVGFSRRRKPSASGGARPGVDPRNRELVTWPPAGTRRGTSPNHG